MGTILLQEHSTASANMESSPFLDLNSCGFVREDKSVMNFDNDEYLLIYIRSGAGELTSGNRSFHLFTGDFIIGRTGEAKSFCPDVQDGCEYYYFAFGGRSSTDIITVLKLAGRDKYFVGHDNELIDSLNKIVAEYQKKDSISPTVSSALLVAALGEMSRLAIHIFPHDQSKGYDKIAPALSSINSDCTSKLGVDDYAKMCNLSTSYFTHLFTKITGFSPLEYKQLQRINIAKNLLSTTNLSIKEISTVIGFKDPLYFGRCFKQSTGQTPSGYRAKK